MFVISFICNGQLKKTSIKGNANDAVDLARAWYTKHRKACSENGYIAIDQSGKHTDNIRFAEIRFDQSPDEVRLYLEMTGDTQPIFKSKFSVVSKQFLVTFLEFGLVKLTEYLMERKNK